MRVLGGILTARYAWKDGTPYMGGANVITKSPHIAMGFPGSSQGVDAQPVDLPLQTGYRRFPPGFDSTLSVGATMDGYLLQVRKQAQGVDKINARLSNLSSGTQTGYKRACRRWVMFIMGAGLGPWGDGARSNWGDLFDVVMREDRVHHLQLATIRGEISGVRFSFDGRRGRAGSPQTGIVYKKLPKALRRTSTTRRNFFFGPEMFRWIDRRLCIAADSKAVCQVWAAPILGFGFILRSSAMGQAHWGDINASEDNCGRRILMNIRTCKTDHMSRGKCAAFTLTADRFARVRIG